MPTFLTVYQSRFSTQLRANWSNPQNSAPTSPDTTLETTADTDVVAQFKMFGITPSADDDRHVAVAVNGIRARLMCYAGVPDWRSEWDGFVEDLKLLAETTSRDRITPGGDSLLSPTEDTSGDLPQFDRKEFNGFIPKAPANPTTQD